MIDDMIVAYIFLCVAGFVFYLALPYLLPIAIIYLIVKAVWDLFK